ncbi:DUF6086 family protein [Actinoplanes sp. NPDC020271]|uniref:DUF6086 family protein n=1 Tax=Actinoplanes sp. NPDC020271 TaxID=3363896 RepID=UPI0037B87E5B
MGKSFYISAAQRYDPASEGPQIWDRSQNTSFMFCEQIASLEKMLKTPSGVCDTGVDVVYVNPPVLRAFILAVFDFLNRSGSWELRVMITGVLRVALFLDSRAHGERIPIPAGFDDVEEGLDDIS